MNAIHSARQPAAEWHLVCNMQVPVLGMTKQYMQMHAAVGMQARFMLAPSAMPNNSFCGNKGCTGVTYHNQV